MAVKPETQTTFDTGNAPDTAAPEKNKQVVASIPADVYKVLNDYRFDNRIERLSKVVKEAVMEKAAKISADNAGKA